MRYLDKFRERLEKKWKGSLVSVRQVRAIEPNAKKYLGQLAKEDQIRKVTWGWYWVPDEYESFLDFLAKDKHFKVVQKQTAAAFWNGDFVHRDHFIVAVRDASYAKALESFASSRKWSVSVEVRDFEDAQYRRIDGIYVEGLEDAIVDCVKEWAFADAFSSLHQNYESVDWQSISRHNWERVSRSDTRVGQVLKYGTSIMGSRIGTKRYPPTRAEITDTFVRRQVEEAAERVVEFA